jgi:phage terminase large subunit-like protein
MNQQQLWASAAMPIPDLTGSDARGGFCHHRPDDLAALVFAVPIQAEPHTGAAPVRVALMADLFIPAAGARNLAAEPFAGWIRDGWLTVTPGTTIDEELIFARIAGRQQSFFQVSSIAMQPHCDREFGCRLQENLGVSVFWFARTIGRFHEPTRKLMLLLEERRILVGANPIFAWAASGLILKYNEQGHVMPDVEQSAHGVGAIVAAIMAIGELMTPGPSVI